MLSALAIAGIAAGAGALGSAAGRGIGWLAGGGLAAKRAEKAEFAAAKKEYRKGQLHGWGKSGTEKKHEKAQARDIIDQGYEENEENLRRTEAAQGFNRSGAGNAQRVQVARAKADTYAKAGGQIEANANADANIKRSMSLQRMAAARAPLAARSVRAANAGAQIGEDLAKAGTSVGLAAYQAKMGENMLNTQAALGLQSGRSITDSSVQHTGFGGMRPMEDLSTPAPR